MSQAHKNTHWIVRVRELFALGFGIEDIAVKLNCPADDVRREFHILREQGTFKEIYGVKKKQDTSGG